MAVTLGKDITFTGISNARSCSVSNSTTEIDVTKFGDPARRFWKGTIDQTVEVECIDDPGVDVGDTFTLSGPQTASANYVVSNISRSEPIDGILTYTVSAKRANIVE